MSSLLLKTENLLGDAGMTVLIGLVVVFATLLALTFIFWLFGKVAGAGSRKPAAAPAAHAVPTAPPASAAAPVVESGVPEEVVAVIAAVAAMSDGTTRYAVRRISAARSQGTRPVWAAAGIAENTQPF